MNSHSSTCDRNVFSIFDGSNGASRSSSDSDHSDYELSDDLDPEYIPRSTNRSNESSESDPDEPSTSRGKKSRSTSRPSAGTTTASRPRTKGREISRSNETLDIPLTVGSDLDDSDSEEETEPDSSELDVSVAYAEHQQENWGQNLDGFPASQPFTGHTGLNPALIDTDTVNESSIFHLFFDNVIIRHLKEETNRYAAELSKSHRHKDMAIVKNWETITLNEMKGFILILLHMGFLRKPSIADYWTKAEFCASKFAAKIMTRDRFKAILSMLHFSDNRRYIPIDEPGHDPLYKIRTIYEHLQEKFQSVYTPKQQIAIDEAMCGWRGRLRFKVYLKDKPTPWGIKLYELCESGSGYVYRFEIYAREPGLSNRPTDVVLRLMDPLLDSGYHLYTDNYYSCPELFQKLILHKTMCTGTVRANRVGMPKDMAKQSLRVGESTFRRKNNLVAMKWRDKREVNMLTSATDPRETSTVTTRNVTNKTKPKIVIDYSKNMSAVDQNDQLLSYLPLSRRTSKWTTKMFMHLLTLTVIQSSIIWNKVRDIRKEKRTKLPNFIKSLGKQLTADFLIARQATPNRPPPRRANKASTLLRLDHSKFHCLNSLPPTPAQDKPRRDCRVCYDKLESVPGKRKRPQRTTAWCKVCEIPLCMEPCFELFHTRLNYVADNPPQ